MYDSQMRKMTVMMKKCSEKWQKKTAKCARPTADAAAAAAVADNVATTTPITSKIKRGKR